jgi:hypothetical protein
MVSRHGTLAGILRNLLRHNHKGAFYSPVARCCWGVREGPFQTHIPSSNL